MLSRSSITSAVIAVLTGLALLAVSAAQALSQSPALPAGPAVAAGEAFLRQVSAQPPQSDLDFVHSHFASRAYEFESDTAIAREIAGLREHSGGIALRSASRTRNAIAMDVLTARTGTPSRVDVMYQGDSLLGYNIRLDYYAKSGPPPQLPSVRVDPDSVAPVIRRWLSWWEQHDLWSGTVAIARRDTSILVDGVGYADRARGIRNDSLTRFHLGSSPKMLTAIAIGQLIDRGKLHLDDTLARVLPEYPDTSVSAHVTVRQLLTHTAGFGGLWELPGYEKKKRYGSNMAYLPIFKGRKLQFTPGSRYSYSNEGFLLLGAIVEKVAGTSYDGWIRENILGPAGMSGWCDCMGMVGAPRRAVGYTHNEENDPFGELTVTDNEGFLGAEGIAAGGYYGTATDYLKLAHALRSGVLLSDSTRAQMWTATQLSGPGRPYGMGFVLNDVDGHPTFGHGGGGGRSGVGVEFSSFRDGSFTVAAFGNRDLYLAGEVAKPILKFLAVQ